MAIRWWHPFVSTKTDGVDSTLVKPSNWNADHKATTDTVSGMVIGRDNQGAGDLEELPASYDPTIGVWTLPVTGGLVPPKGTTAQRPATPAAGTMRYNSSNSQVECFVGGAWRTIACTGSSFGANLAGDLTMGPNGSIQLQNFLYQYNYDGSFALGTGVWSPLVPGAYMVSAFANMAVDAGGAMRLIVQKSGTVIIQQDTYSPGGPTSASGSIVVYMNVGDWCDCGVQNLDGSSGARVFGGGSTGFSASYAGT